MIPAAHFFRRADSSALELTEEELGTAEAVRVRSRQGCRGGWGGGGGEGVRALGVCSAGGGPCTSCVRVSWPQACRGSVFRMSPGPTSSAGSHPPTARGPVAGCWEGGSHPRTVQPRVQQSPEGTGQPGARLQQGLPSGPGSLFSPPCPPGCLEADPLQRAGGGRVHGLLQVRGRIRGCRQVRRGAGVEPPGSLGRKSPPN